MWEEVVPIDQNGVITMYQVLYQPLETFGGAIGPLTVNVTELTADLTDLEDYVNYTISVRARTSVGEGPYSDGAIVLTLQGGKCMQIGCHVQSGFYPVGGGGGGGGSFLPDVSTSPPKDL